MKVAVGILVDAAQRILITQRHWDKSHGGYWEFPGGKLESEETPQQALQREMAEELGISVVSFHYLGDISHTYAHTNVTLIVFKITEFVGDPQCREDQLELRWVSPQELSDYTFPEANLAIIRLIDRNHSSQF